MEYRLGKCSACGAEFKVPASFAHDVARCKVCSGVVHLGPPGGGPPAAANPVVPAKKVVKKEAPLESADAEEKRKKRGTLERLKAERAAAAKAAEEKPAPAAAAKPKPSTARAKPAGARPKSVVAGKTRGSSSKRRDAKGDGEGRSRRGSKGKKEKKKAPVGALLALLLVVGGGAAAFFFLGGEDEPSGDVVAAENSAVEPEPEQLSVDEGNAMIGGPDEEDPAAEDESAGADEEAAAAPEPKKGEPYDMTTLPDYGPARGTTDEEWAEMNELMATFMDIDAGAAGPRAGRRLEEIGRKAFPVIINHMKTLDFSTEEGYRVGFSCQKTLEKILNGNNFDWWNQDKEGYVEFNKKVVRSFATVVWEKVMIDIEAWIKAAKLETKDPEEAARLRRLYGSGDDEPEPVEATPTADFDDDLDVD